MAVLQSRGGPRISSKTAIIIGATIGGIYIIIVLILIHIFLQRRLKKKLLNQQQRVPRTANSHQSTLYLSFHENFASPQSRGGQSHQGRSSRAHSDARSYHPRRKNHGSARSAGTLSPIRERPKTRRRGDYEEEHEDNWIPVRRDSGSTRTRSGSDSTVHRYRSHSSSDNPFGLFDGTYTSSPNLSSSRNLRRHSYSTTSTYRPRHSKSSGFLMPTDVFVSEMNAKYPEASVRPTNSSKSMALIRQVSLSPSPSLNDRPPSRTPSQQVLHEIQENDESFLPIVPLDPLIRRKSIERIVSGQYPQPKIIEIKGKGKEKEKIPYEVTRMGTAKRVRELVDVSLNGVGHKGHARNKSSNAFNDFFYNMVGRRKSRVSGETEGTEREHIDIRPSIETMSEKA